MDGDSTGEARKELMVHLLDTLLRATALSIQMGRNESRLEALRDALRLMRQEGSHTSAEAEHPEV